MTDANTEIAHIRALMSNASIEMTCKDVDVLPEVAKLLPPGTDTYLVSGMEEVWLKRLSTADFLKKLDETFKADKEAGKAPAIPPRA